MMSLKIKFSKPATKEEIAEANKKGMILKKDLKDRSLYKGYCRNAQEAMWVKEIERFIYVRHKWGSEFLEDICHVEDDNLYDLFIPLEEIPVTEPVKLLFKTDIEELIAHIKKYKNMQN